MRDKKPFKALALISQVGFNVLVPILAFILLGAWVDKKINGRGIALLLCTCVGVAAGLSNIIRLGKKL